MAETPKQSEQSMEEILQSIKRIIADEGDDTVPAPASSETDDVLELTEMVTEDDISEAPAGNPMSVDALLDSLADPSHVAPESEPTKPVVEVVANDEDDTNHITESFEEQSVAAEPQAKDEVMASKPSEPVAKVLDEDRSIASTKTLAASAAALKQLKPEPVRESEYRAERVSFRSGLTLEDLVLEALRPMLRDWVDSNMPPMVERMVAREIEKIRSQVS